MIVLKNIFKRFGDVEVCNDTNYKFKDKGLTCFFGPSGSGKTTIFNLIAGFDKSYEGDIEVNSKSIKNLTKEDLCRYRFNNIGFVFQNYNLLSGYTALENVLMGIHLNNEITEGEKMKRALDLIDSLGLKDHMDQDIETLSGGEKQRVAIARALINKPKLILADEPTGALDSESTKAIMEILKDISISKKVIMISHDEDVLSYADEVVELEEGKIKGREVDSNKEVLEINNGYYNEKEPYLNKETARFISLKNFKIHISKFILAALIIAFGSAAFVASLSTKKITNNLINDFKEKNFFYNTATVPTIDEENSDFNIDEVYNKLESMDEIENVYYQYDLENIKLKNGDKVLEIPAKVPTAIANETLAYGNMPRRDTNEVVISQNVANRLNDDIKSLIGKDITLEYVNNKGQKEDVILTVSGLTNSKFQDFILSEKVEKEVYKSANINKEKPTAISLTIKAFEQIPQIDELLKSEKIGVVTKASDVLAFQTSFNSLLKLYTVLSYLILIVGLVISCIILHRVTVERSTEIGTFGALGYTKGNINKIMIRESLYFATLSTMMSFMCIYVFDVIYKGQFGYGIDISRMSIGILVALNLVLTIGLSTVINSKLVKLEIAKALRM